jgi:hypothetical protein
MAISEYEQLVTCIRQDLDAAREEFDHAKKALTQSREMAHGVLGGFTAPDDKILCRRAKVRYTHAAEAYWHVLDRFTRVALSGTVNEH